MKYSEFIKGNEGFQYSVNLQYDLYNTQKVKGYIPTKKSIEILKQYLVNTKIKDASKATVLIGPYGKGKSHLLLVLLNILCSINKDGIDDLVNKIEKIDKGCSELVREIFGIKKYIPIILNSNSMDINQSFLIALKQSLTRLGEDNIIPDTYFDSAINVIEGWRNYPETFDRVQNLINEQCGSTVELFINQLNKYNKTTYEIFKNIFKEVTAGVEFNPMVNTDIVKLYEEVNHILHDKYGYDGMIVVFDEFSKFIEASAVHNTSRELKILQDFAELTNRSDRPQIHFICVTHKTVNEYISHIPKEKIDAWRAIEGRFEEVYFNSSSQQNYELISNAINKDTEKFNEFWKEHRDSYSSYYDDSFSIYNHLYTTEEFEENIIKGCFPLSPYTTYALPSVSEKVAQNERTLFTFLSKADSKSLLDIIRNNNGEKELVTVDDLYDYFEPLFKKEVFNQKIHDLWLKTDTALKYTKSKEEESIIKSLAIINIIDDNQVLPATIDNIAKTIGVEKDKNHNLIDELRNRNILMLRKSNNTIDFMPISTIDVEGKIKESVELKKKNIDVSTILNELIGLKYILPRKYNDKYKMVRYFNNIFMTSQEITSYENVQLLLNEKGGDGVVVNLFTESEEEKIKVKEWINNINDDRVIVYLANKEESVRDLLGRYIVINEFLDNQELLSEDLVLESQLNVLLEDIVVHIKNIVSNMYYTENNTILINKNNLVSNLKFKISDKVSEICEEYYSNSPIINNELINKKSISAPILKGRNSIVTMLLNNTYKEFNSDGNSVECTLFRTTIKNKGLLSNNISEDMNPLLNEIREFVVNAEAEELSFGSLYNEILNSNKGIAVREGIIPLYIAFILKDYLDEAIILVGDRSKKEVSLNYEIINNINANPKEYFLKIERGTKEKEDYIESLEEMFKEFRLRNATENRYVNLVKSIQVWMQSLSKYAKTTQIDITSNELIDKKINKLRSALSKFDINSRKFVYTDLLKIFGSKNYKECEKSLKAAKKYLDDRDKALMSVVRDITKNTFNKSYQGEVSSIIQTWILKLDDKKVNHVYDVRVNSFIETINQKQNTEENLLSKLVFVLTGLVLEDWNDESLFIYITELNRAIKTIEEFEVACDSDDNEGLIKLSFISEDGNENEKTFDKVEISSMGLMVLNSLEDALEEFGDSIDDNEKRNVIIKMLEKFI